MYLQIWSLIVAARFVKIESDACFDVIAQFSIVCNFWLVNLSSYERLVDQSKQAWVNHAYSLFTSDVRLR